VFYGDNLGCFSFSFCLSVTFYIAWRQRFGDGGYTWTGSDAFTAGVAGDAIKYGALPLFVLVMLRLGPGCFLQTRGVVFVSLHSWGR
jgi:hypothetical protein